MRFAMIITASMKSCALYEISITFYIYVYTYVHLSGHFDFIMQAHILPSLLKRIFPASTMKDFFKVS